MFGTKWRSRVQEIDQKILFHEEQIALLRSERKSVARDLDAIVYPVLTLPNEITSEIFVHYVESHPNRSPLHLTWVCRSWRAVAISTCRLWTQCIDLYAASALPIWLSRAGSLPLNLEFHLRLDLARDGWRIDSLYETVSRFSSQFESLTVSSFRPIQLPPVPFPRLRKLFISDGIWGWEDEIAHYDGPYLNAPSLREVVLKGECVKMLQTALPKTQLTKLSLEADLADCLAILAHTPNLQELEIISE
ncbi:hypothetical protein FB45DRAFT_824676, partial [Roridomyces roridus]